MAEMVDSLTNGILVGGGGTDHATPQRLLLKYANRHGLIAGATGTGKTVTLQTLAESLSLAGVPVFMADVKGDLAGLARPGSATAPAHAGLSDRAARIGVPLDYQSFPVTFWDLWGEKGHPVRTTPAEMGPLLLSRLLGLTEAQEGVMNIAFRLADEQGLALLDLQDLQAMLAWIGQHAADLSLRYGNVGAASVGAIQRALLVLENQGAGQLFGEPALALSDLLCRDAQGRGMISILAADRLMQAPRLYATLLLWLLSELFEELPEIGDPERPRIAFFFDEAHLLFDDAPRALIEKVEQVARLIRSKGVSLWFVSQNPEDIPEKVLGQLGNRVQHALRAFTAKDQKALRIAAQNYRANPDFDTAEAIRTVGTGEAVTSLLEEKGVPGIAQRTLIRPPFSRMGPISDAERASVMAASAMAAKYADRIDRISARELLARRTGPETEPGTGTPTDAKPGSDRGKDLASGRARPTRARSSRSDSILETFGKSLARQLGTKSGQALVRGVLGSLLRGR